VLWRNRTYLLVKEAAKMLGVSKQRVHQMLASGQLGGVREDGMVFVRAETVEARIEARKGLDC